MKTHALILAAAGVLTTGVHAADSYSIDSRHTYPVFEVKHLGFSTQRGRFNKVTGKIVLDRAAKSGSVDVVIDVASIDMGIDKWDDHMKSEDFFHVEKYPTMTYKSDRLRFEGDKLVGVDGQLTLLGVTRPVSLQVTHFHCGMNPAAKREGCGADALATIKRSEFGMSRMVPALGDEIAIRIPIEAFKE
jgi:polyisoprenoid-binding protein YceI